MSIWDGAPPSQRLLGAAIPEPVLGFPDYLRAHLDRMLVDGLDFAEPALLDSIALRLRIAWTYERNYLRDLVSYAAKKSEATYLDLMQYALRIGIAANALDDAYAEVMRQVLEDAGSAYAVGPDSRTIVMRNDSAAERAARAAVEAEDDASDELASAWNHVFGIEPDARGGWAAAIRAVEDVLIPVIWPDATRRGKQTLTTARDRLRDRPQDWTLDHPKIRLDVLVSMLSSLAWEPGRHGADPAPDPTVADAAAAVHLAVTLVSWLRAGLLRRA